MRRRRFTSIAVLVCGLLLAGCQASEWETVDAYTDGGGTIRCVQGQSAVGETTDLTADKDIPFGATTAARRDLNCINAQASLGSSWQRIEVEAALFYHSGYSWLVCARPADASTTSVGDVTAAMAFACGDAYYYVNGVHRATRPGGSSSTGWTTSPTVFVNPN